MRMRLLQYPLDSSTGVIRPLPLGEGILVPLGAQDTLAQYSPYFRLPSHHGGDTHGTHDSRTGGARLGLQRAHTEDTSY